MGVEPTYQPWEGRILPMNYTRKDYFKKYILFSSIRQVYFSKKNGADKNIGPEFVIFSERLQILPSRQCLLH